MPHSTSWTDGANDQEFFISLYIVYFIKYICKRVVHCVLGSDWCLYLYSLEKIKSDIGWRGMLTWNARYQCEKSNQSSAPWCVYIFIFFKFQIDVERVSTCGIDDDVFFLTFVAFRFMRFVLKRNAWIYYFWSIESNVFSIGYEL